MPQKSTRIDGETKWQQLEQICVRNGGGEKKMTKWFGVGGLYRNYRLTYVNLKFTYVR